MFLNYQLAKLVVLPIHNTYQCIIYTPSKYQTFMPCNSSSSKYQPLRPKKGAIQFEDNQVSKATKLVFSNNTHEISQWKFLTFFNFYNKRLLFIRYYMEWWMFIMLKKVSYSY